MRTLPLRAPHAGRCRRAGTATTEPGGLAPASRAGVLLLLVLAVFNGVFLYLAPDRAQFDYAWSIRPSASAAFLGAGYLAGTLATALVVWRTSRWRSLRILPLPLVVLSLALLAATLIHAGRFRWGYPPTWVWTAVYVGVPPVVAWLWRIQERSAPPAPVADPRLRRLRALSAALGLVLAAGAIALYAVPDTLADAWPWPLPPLMARAVASWYLLVACALLTAAVSLRRPNEVPIGYATLLAWTVLLMLLPLLHAGDLAGRDAALTAWLFIHGLLLALAAYALRLSVPLMRAAGERL